jgi:hypothetical protein
MINGSPSRFFNSSHYLKQGDPLSFLLFVVVMEALSRMSFALVDKRLLLGFSLGSRNIEELLVSHLMFSYDTLIFCEAKLAHFCHLRYLFLCFEPVSRLKISVYKSGLVPLGVVDDVGGFDLYPWL